MLCRTLIAVIASMTAQGIERKFQRWQHGGPLWSSRRWWKRRPQGDARCIPALTWAALKCLEHVVDYLLWPCGNVWWSWKSSLPGGELDMKEFVSLLQLWLMDVTWHCSVTTPVGRWFHLFASENGSHIDNFNHKTPSVPHGTHRMSELDITLNYWWVESTDVCALEYFSQAFHRRESVCQLSAPGFEVPITTSNPVPWMCAELDLLDFSVLMFWYTYAVKPEEKIKDYHTIYVLFWVWVTVNIPDISWLVRAW